MARSNGGPSVESLVSAHVTHRWATVDQLEMASAKEARSLLRAVREMGGVEECALLKTCNRVEIYAVARDPARVRERLREFFGDSVEPDMVRIYTGGESARHLFSVAAGLDSMIVGEGQILGQIREAYRFARKEGTVGRTLDALFQKALSTGKEARTRTAIGRGNVSIGSATVELARKLCGGSLEGRSVVILGAGDMARAVARSLVKQKVQEVTFANRTLGRARDLAGLLEERGDGGHSEAVSLAEMAGPISRADVLICASSAPHAVVTREEMESILRRRSRKSRPLMVIDISNPRNVDRTIGKLPGVRLYNIDGLREVARRNLRRRRAEMARVGALVDRAAASLAEKAAPGEDLLRRLYRSVEEVKAAELERSLRKMALGPEQEEVLRALVDSLAGKILAGPAGAIREASARRDARLLRSAERIFNLGG